MKTKGRLHTGYKPYIFLLPSVVFLAIFTYYPIYYSVRYSFTSFNLFSPKPVFNGFENYISLFNNEVFWEVVINNIIYAVFTIFPTMILALLLAILVNETKKFKSVIELGLFYPMLIPMAAAAMIWVFMLDPGIGVINKFLGLIGLPEPGWLGDDKAAIWALIIMAIWKNVGYFMLIYLAGLQNIPNHLYEAAEIEGAGWWRKHFTITFPLVSPSTIFVFIVSIIQSFKVFTQIHLMTKGGPGYSTTVLVYYIYENAFNYWDIGTAAALTTILIISLLFLVIMVFGVFGKKVHYSLS
ncbi:MAG: sn-glycerol 3-phosphate transport system permease protein [Kosmotogales bacterium]|nr:sn-glycerol 3-phosphate transport system permease protein [Kosmotogales bacterium]